MIIVACPDCEAKYEINSPRSVAGEVNVRCPRCRSVFPVRGGEPAPATTGRRMAAVGPARKQVTDPALARRLARAMISEMVLNRRRERDEALHSGAVLSRFGPAIAGAYDLYSGKVSPHLGEAPDIFREAVNEILGEGRRIL